MNNLYVINTFVNIIDITPYPNPNILIAPLRLPTIPGCM